MVKVVGSFRLGKEMMKEKRAQLVKDIKSETSSYNVSGLEKLIPVYSVSVTIPATYEGLIINGLLLTRFIKKLKGFRYEVQVDDKKLILNYGKRWGRWTGRLELPDLSEYFKDYPNIPRLEVK